jgi:sulfoxide reductase heme-binding subunit YedZ
LAVAAGAITAAVEALWYAVATHLDVARVIEANLDFYYGPRPAVVVALVGLLVFVATAFRRVARRVTRRRGSGLVRAR